MQIAARQLEAVISRLEEKAAEGRYNTFCIRALASAATLLGREAVAQRAIRLLRETPDEAFWAGAITNIQLPAVVPEELRRIGSPEELENRYPAYRRENIIERIRSFAVTDKHLAPCLDDHYQEALTKAVSGWRLQDVGVTFAVLGEFDAAQSLARDPGLDDAMKQGLLLVLVLEFFRSERIEEFQAALAELESAGLDEWRRIYLALGIAGREPWGGYPYTDW
jgi:hypothetical protein